MPHATSKGGAVTPSGSAAPSAPSSPGPSRSLSPRCLPAERGPASAVPVQGRGHQTSTSPVWVMNWLMGRGWWCLSRCSCAAG